MPLADATLFYCPVNLSLAFRPPFVRSGSARSYPRQLPPHLEMTLVYCSRDFSTLRSLYPRQYWSLTTEKEVPLGIHTNVNTYAAVSYWSCFVFFCRRFWRFFTICFLSPSFVVRHLHLQFVCLSSFILLLGPLTTPYVSCSGYGLVPVLSVSCSISFRACSIQISFFVLWLSILLKFIWYGYMITT